MAVPYPDPRLLSQGAMPGLNPGTPMPAPSMGPQDMAALVLNQLQPPGAAYSPQTPSIAAEFGDPTLAGFEAAPPPPLDVELGLPDRLKTGYMPALDEGV